MEETAVLGTTYEDRDHAFNPYSLGDWLAACTRARVPFVSAEHIATIETHDILHFDTPGPHQQRLNDAWEEIDRAKKPGHMLRWDICTNLHLKSRLAHGQPEWHPDLQELTVDDPRFYEFCFEWQRLAMPVWQRPWVKACIEDRYPVEYRVFVKDGEIIGVSSYYPQRPLRFSAPEIEGVCSLTRRLIDVTPPPYRLLKSLEREVRGLPDKRLVTPGRDDQEFTADFLVRPDGWIVFLEGGPLRRASGCCFKGEPIGIALVDEHDPEDYEGVVHI